MWLILGLGNPGSEYAHTRHNVGYLVIDELLASLSPMSGTLSVHKKTNSLICTGSVGGESVILARSRTYMNLSGGPTAALAAFYKIAPENIIVIHDELDLPPGAIRLKKGGGDNGHNGLKSITQSLKTPDYMRIRVGIGRPPGRMDPASFVLKNFSTEDNKELPVTVARAADAVELLITQGLSSAQNIIHGN